jgi:hypothetical protein
MMTDAFVFGGRRIPRRLKTEDGDVRVIQYLMDDLEVPYIAATGPVSCGHDVWR